MGPMKSVQYYNRGLDHLLSAQKDGIILPEMKTMENSTLNSEAMSVSAGIDMDWVEKAVTIFRRYRVVVFRDMFSASVTDMIYKSLEEVHANWSAKLDPERFGNRMAGRYELMDAYDSGHLTHLPGYLEALEEFARKGGLRFLEALGRYKFVGGHAHLCLARTENWQPLHSDFVQPNRYQTA